MRGIHEVKETIARLESALKRMDLYDHDRLAIEGQLDCLYDMLADLEFEESL